MLVTQHLPYSGLNRTSLVLHKELGNCRNAFLVIMCINIPGGKYRGRHVSELVTEDPAYCQWILRVAKAPSLSGDNRNLFWFGSSSILDPVDRRYFPHLSLTQL